MKRAIVAVVLVLALGWTAFATTGPCYTVFEDLADSKHDERMWNAAIFGGAGVLVAGLAVLDSGSSAAPMVAISAVVFGLPAAAYALIPSRVEREWNDLVRSGVTETGCVVRLSRVAERGERTRYIRAVGNGALSLASLAIGDFYTFLFEGGYAAYRLLMPSEEEKAYERYLAISQGIAP